MNQLTGSKQFAFERGRRITDGRTQGDLSCGLRWKVSNGRISNGANSNGRSQIEKFERRNSNGRTRLELDQNSSKLGADESSNHLGG